MGEIPQYDDFRLTHGTCRRCHPATLSSVRQDLSHARRLKAVQRKLWKAGHLGDQETAERIVLHALNAGTKPADVLMGIVAPLLYQVGQDWDKGLLSVADEHRFTSVCEAIYQFILQRSEIALSARPKQTGNILLINAPGNMHTLAIRILALWLMGEGRPAEVVQPHSDVVSLASTIMAKRPPLVLISIALPEQGGGVEKLTSLIAERPAAIRPKVIVGGHAIKKGLVSSLRGAHLLPDISSLT